MSKYTPGPWTYLHDDYGPAIAASDTEGGMVVVARVLGEGLTDVSENDANARLVAIAPDLFSLVSEMCEAIEAGETEYGTSGDWFTEARAAIDRAEGRS